jgi:hypothetical protein
MGLTSSTEATTSSDVVNEAITNVLMKNSSNCAAIINQSQTVRRTGKSKFSDVSQYGELNATCLQDNQVTSDVTNAIAAEIYQQAEATQTQLLGTLMADTEATTISNIQNVVETKIDFSFLQRCDASITQDQNVMDNGTIIGSDVKQVANLYQECIQRNVADTQVANDIVANVSQTVKAETESFFGDLFGDIATIIIMAIILIVIVGLIFFFILRGGGRGKGAPGRTRILVPRSAPVAPVTPSPVSPASPESAPPELPANLQGAFTWSAENNEYRDAKGNAYDPESSRDHYYSPAVGDWVPIENYRA